MSIKQEIILPKRVVILGSGGFISNALEDLLVKSKINFIYKNIMNKNNDIYLLSIYLFII